jgi:hypothetical protein
MRITLFVLAFLAHLSSIATDLSESAEIKIMTMGPGQNEVYSAFGHSAIRVSDPVQGIDVVYNYGIFDFDQPNFYINFAKGKLLYQLGKSDYQRTLQYYEYFNRSVKEQTLNLTAEQKQKMVDFLEENYLPENRDYLYNYIYDNCATKIQDVLEAVFPNQITYDYSFVEEDKSYRNLMDMYLGQQPWGDLGIDICLGLEIDNTSPPKGYLFLPDYVFAAFEKATINTNGELVPLVIQSANVYNSAPAPDAALWFTPIMLFSVLFLLGGLLSHRELKYGLWYKWFDVTLFSIAGIVGCLLLLLWVATDHLSQYNFNLLWAIPLHLPVAILLLKSRSSLWLKKYFLVAGVIQIALIVSWGFLPQDLHQAFIPLVLILALRSLLLWGRKASL